VGGAVNLTIRHFLSLNALCAGNKAFHSHFEFLCRLRVGQISNKNPKVTRVFCAVRHKQHTHLCYKWTLKVLF